MLSAHNTSQLVILRSLALEVTANINSRTESLFAMARAWHLVHLFRMRKLFWRQIDCK